MSIPTSNWWKKPKRSRLEKEFEITDTDIFKTMNILMLLWNLQKVMLLMNCILELQQ